jgi:hypothetical protein
MLTNKQYLVTPCCRVLLANLAGSETVKKFHAFYANRRFITAPKSARHLSLYWARLIQSIPPHELTYLTVNMHSGSAHFEFEPGHRLTRTVIVFLILSCDSIRISIIYHRFLSNPFQYTIHQSSCHRLHTIQDTEGVVKKQTNENNFKMCPKYTSELSNCQNNTTAHYKFSVPHVKLWKKRNMTLRFPILCLSCLKAGVGKKLNIFRFHGPR